MTTTILSDYQTVRIIEMVIGSVKNGWRWL